MRGFFAGFTLAALAIWGVATTPAREPTRAVANTRFVMPPAPSAKDAGADPAVVQSDPVQPCITAFTELVARHTLIFDHRSEQLRADLMFLIDASVDALAWCPGTMIQVEITHHANASDRSIKLAQRRAAFLAERWAAQGLPSATSEVRSTAANVGDPTSTIRLRAVKAQR